MTATSPTLLSGAQGASKKPTIESADSKKATVDYEAFLKLLTAQLRNQDPLSPMDATQFMTQLAQLSTVEQAVKTNDTLIEVKDMLHNTSMRMDLAYLGRKVQAMTDMFGLSDGKAEMAYAVDGTAASVRIEVIDEAGRTVRTASGALGGGRQIFTWDGKTDAGAQAPDGTYQVRIKAKDKNGDSLNVATVVTDSVKEVRTLDGTTYFILQGGAAVQINDIIAAST
jgi:flagellar basal-body rod modification protein FlgD